MLEIEVKADIYDTQKNLKGLKLGLGFRFFEYFANLFQILSY